MSHMENIFIESAYGTPSTMRSQRNEKGSNSTKPTYPNGIRNMTLERWGQPLSRELNFKTILLEKSNPKNRVRLETSQNRGC